MPLTFHNILNCFNTFCSLFFRVQSTWLHISLKYIFTSKFLFSKCHWCSPIYSKYIKVSINKPSFYKSSNSFWKHNYRNMWISLFYILCNFNHIFPRELIITTRFNCSCPRIKYLNNKPLGETKERDATLALLVREALGTFGGTREAVEAALGTPRRVITAKENPNIVLRYEGVLVTLNGNKGGSKVIALEVSSPEKGLKGGMVPGMSRESLRKLLGKPNKTDKKDESFLSGHGEGISVRIRKDGSAIDSIRVGKL